LSTVEWPSAQVIPSCAICPAAVTFASTPTTASRRNLDRRGWTPEVGTCEEARGQPRGVHFQAYRDSRARIDRGLHDRVEVQDVRPERLVTPGFVTEDRAPTRRNAAARESRGGGGSWLR
jgi:hypothetical protein